MIMDNYDNNGNTHHASIDYTRYYNIMGWLHLCHPALQEVLEPITEEQKGYLTVTWASRCQRCWIAKLGQMFHVIYPLVNVYITMEHHHFLWVNQL